MMFRRALWEIRKCAPSLRSLILYQDNRYRLNPALQVWVDALEFQRCLAQASGATEEAKKTAFLEGAVALYEGPLLPGIYYSWADNLRNAFEEQYTKALGSLSEKYAKNAEYDKCITCCHKYLQVNNLNEEMHRLLIANYVHLGDKSKALKHYELLRKTLRKELKSEPSPETTSLIESLR
jgi:DNA-binding SARP family transcriptional activator